MMPRLLVALALGSSLVLGLGNDAAADHLAGRYTVVSGEPAQIVGSVLELRQNGRALVGQITGTNYKARLRAETDGHDSARGYLRPENGKVQYIEAAFDPKGIRMSVMPINDEGKADTRAAVSIRFTRDGASAPTR
jgi:hypothetical protein